MRWLVGGVALGVGIGLLFKMQLSLETATYVAIFFLAGLDSVLGAVKAGIEDHFDLSIFFTGFLANTLLATGLTYLGNHIGVNLYLAAVVTFGVRIFQNLAFIRRDLISKPHRHAPRPII